MRVTFCYAGKIGGLGQGYITYHTAKAAIHANSLYQLIACDFPCDLARQAKEAVRIKRPDEFLLMRGTVSRLLRKFGLTYFLSNGIFDLKAKKIIKECDVFHAFASQSLNSMIRAKELGAKIIADNPNSHPLTLHKLMTEEYKVWGVPYSPDNPITIKRRLKALEIADRAVILSNFAYKSFLENGFERDRLRIAPYGVDTELFKPREKKDNVFRALFVGQISLRKGFQYLLEAWSILQLKNAELILAGSMAKDAEYALSKYKGRINFKLTGPLPDMKSIAACYNQASVAVFPSIEDGFGMVVSEAMASGLPVVVSENTGAKDLVENGVEGFIVPIRSPEAIRDAILRLYENENKRKQMGQKARLKSENRTWESYQNKLMAVYKELEGK